MNRKQPPHPASQSIPENRRGTRSFRAYASFSSSGEDARRYPGGMTAALATRRQWKKATVLWESPEIRRASDIRNGRVLRAVYRSIAQSVGEYADSQIYGA